MPINYRFDPLQHYEVDAATGCWNWKGSRNSEGYGEIRRKNLNVKAHRHFYTSMVGPIPDGLVIDHLCRNRGCVNPSHLEPVTQRENKLRGVGSPAVNYRKVTCSRGHDNWAMRLRNGRKVRMCRECKNDRERFYWNRDKQKLQPQPEPKP